MSLNKSTGNMYSFCNYTWNPIGGLCPFDCSYCFMKRFKLGELTLRKHFLKDSLVDRGTVFVGSSCDMWADEVPDEWIVEVLEYCHRFPETKFLFQSKNPVRFVDFRFPPNTMLGTTLETNRDHGVSKAPSPEKRYKAFASITKYWDIVSMVSVEPVMDFDLDVFVRWIRDIAPDFVSVGADSKEHNLPEPPVEKVTSLIEELKQFTEVRVKSNLKRLGAR